MPLFTGQINGGAGSSQGRPRPDQPGGRKSGRPLAPLAKVMEPSNHFDEVDRIPEGHLNPTTL
jgi:hypothetical protein